jgi:hypothetical protein
MADEEIDNRESVAHMLSEFLREIAALILVFVPLDYLLRGPKPIQFFWFETIVVVVGAALLLIVGILVERRSH